MLSDKEGFAMDHHSEEPPVSPVFPPSVPMQRRAFLRTLAAVGGATLLAACGGAPTAPAQGGAATSAPAGTAAEAPTPAVLPTSASASGGEPKRGGVYRALTEEQFGTLDAARAFNYMDWWISYTLLYNRLYGFDSQGNIVDDLADGMAQVSSDGLTYTVKLKQGIKFHNGREVTADDVKFSFDRVMWKEVESPGTGYLSNVVGYDEAAADTARELSGIKVLDPLTVQFTLKQSQAVFPAILGVTTFGILPQKEVIDAAKDWGTNVLIGTGPFKLAEWRNGELFAAERNPDYFKVGKPYLDRIEIKLNVKPEVGVLQWESGEAEFAYTIPPADLARIRADEALKGRIREGPSNIFYRLSFANNAKPFDDVRVRQAVAMAIDKANLAKISQNGVPLEGILTAGLPQFDPDFKSAYPYDPEKAKQLLKDAGVPEGFKTIFWSGGTSKILGEAIQADLKAIGLDPELLVLEGSSYDTFKPRIENAELPMMTWGFGPDYPDGSSFVAAQLVCPPDAKKVQFCDEKIAELAKQVDALPLADAKRTEALRQIEQIVVNEQVYHVPLYARNSLILSQDYVRGDMPDPGMTLPLAENVWFDK